MTDLVFVCPHCDTPFIVRETEINCGIFRHGAYRATLEPLPPHLPRDQCQDLLERNLIWGCAKPIQITLPEKIIQKCDYI